MKSQGDITEALYLDVVEFSGLPLGIQDLGRDRTHLDAHIGVSSQDSVDGLALGGTQGLGVPAAYLDKEGGIVDGHPGNHERAEDRSPSRLVDAGLHGAFESSITRSDPLFQLHRGPPTN